MSKLKEYTRIALSVLLLLIIYLLLGLAAVLHAIGNVFKAAGYMLQFEPYLAKRQLDKDYF